MEIIYEKITRKEHEQGICLLTIAITYPVFSGDTPAILHINDFEKQYAETLAAGLISNALPTQREALNAHFTSGGRRSRFPTQHIVLTGQGRADVGRIVWQFRLYTRCGGKVVEHHGERVWNEKGILQA